MSVDANPMPSDEDRQILREAVRGFLSRRWRSPATSSDPAEATRFWQEVVAQGLADFGRDETEGGLRELAIAMEEFGFAACPLPLFVNGIANLLLARVRESGAPSAELEQLLARRTMLALAFGDYDHDRNAGSATDVGNNISGRLRFVEGADTATHFLTFAGDPATLAIVAADAKGVEVTATPSMGESVLFEVSLSDVAAAVIRVPEGLIRDLNLVARLCLLARAYGAARRSFEMVVAYSKVRRQFGQPIGRFQAIQHKLANCMIGLEGVRLTLQKAVASYDLQQTHWRYFASAAFAFGSAALRQISLETHHAWGAIGYADEHEAPRHFRRIHNDVVRFGGVSQARRELADFLLGPDGSLPEYDLGAAGNA